MGNYKGFEIKVSFNHLSHVYTAELISKASYFTELGTDNIKRIDNTLEKLENIIEERTQRLSQHKSSLSDVRTQLKVPFPNEQELKTKSERLSQLNIELDLNSKGNRRFEKSRSLPVR